MKTLIVCASKYASTMQIGRWIAERLSYEGFVVDILKAGETNISLRLTKDEENTPRPNPLPQGEREPNNPPPLMEGSKGEGEINAFSEQEITIDGYDLIIMGSGIYNHYVLPELRDYMEKNKDVLRKKSLALFGVAMKTTPIFYKGKIHGGIEHLMPTIEMFGKAVVHADMLQGTIN